jgi:hypothetical protein
MGFTNLLLASLLVGQVPPPSPLESREALTDTQGRILFEARRIILDADSCPRQPAEIVEGPNVASDRDNWLIRFQLDNYDDVLLRIVAIRPCLRLLEHRPPMERSQITKVRHENETNSFEMLYGTPMHAAWALVQLGDQSGVPVLVEFLDSDLSLVRTHAERLLQEITSQRLGTDKQAWRRWLSQQPQGSSQTAHFRRTCRNRSTPSMRRSRAHATTSNGEA